MIKWLLNKEASNTKDAVTAVCVLGALFILLSLSQLVTLS